MPGTDPSTRPRRVQVDEARAPYEMLRFCFFSPRELPEENRRVFTAARPRVIANQRGRLEFIGEELDISDAEVLLTCLAMARIETVRNPARKTITEVLAYRGSFYNLVKNLPAVRGEKKRIGRNYRHATERSLSRLRGCTLKLVSPGGGAVAIEEGPIRKAWLRDANGFLHNEIYVEFSDWMKRAFQKGFLAVVSFEAWRRLSGIGKVFYLFVLGQKPSFKRSVGNLAAEMGVSSPPNKFVKILEKQLGILEEMGVLEWEINKEAKNTRDWVISWRRRGPSLQANSDDQTAPPLHT